MGPIPVVRNSECGSAVGWKKAGPLKEGRESQCSWRQREASVVPDGSEERRRRQIRQGW